jgi:hypothetical protein
MLLLTNPPSEDRWDRLQGQTHPSELPAQFRVLLEPWTWAGALKSLFISARAGPTTAPASTTSSSIWAFPAPRVSSVSRKAPK